MSMVARLDSWLYPETPPNWDDQLFRELVVDRMPVGATILDLGAGAGIVPYMDFRGLAKQVCGVDLDPRVVDNPMLDEGRVADAGRIPYDDGMFDLVFSDNVVEHLDDPATVFAEVGRVLKPGGTFLFKTPNLRHYMPTIARFTPHGFHRWVNRKRGRAEIDTFPTRYRANTPRAVSRLAAGAGLKVGSIMLVEGRPEYLRMTWPTYLIGAVYERVVNAWEGLGTFRILLIAELRKPSS